ncbi:hypothetical protein [Chamaesiphon sp. VAR_48_metabat_135_sub]|uniref:hypothetical protein n=1 Tax=Chamaesiphon sp. VAR_48_metabat_135_sub TaxID=2964699 RepID=UPI00286C6FEF|nr:hypothetical protein [Chamaesiphon sp. VAR_48_metabat_135_sub]
MNLELLARGRAIPVVASTSEMFCHKFKSAIEGISSRKVMGELDRDRLRTVYFRNRSRQSFDS